MVERSTSRTTASAPYHLRRSGVGFVRFANKDDAIKSLEGLRNNPVILPGCTAPVEAKFADKHNPDSRRRRLATTQINGAVRGQLPTAQIPLLQQPTQVGYAQGVYNALYGAAAYRPGTGAASLASPAPTSPYSAYPMSAAAYGGLSGVPQTLLTTTGNGLYPLSPSQTVQALTNGSHTDTTSSGLQTSSIPQLLLQNGLATSSALTLPSYGHCLDYATAGHAAAAVQSPYSYVLQAQHADH